MTRQLAPPPRWCPPAASARRPRGHRAPGCRRSPRSARRSARCRRGGHRSREPCCRRSRAPGPLSRHDADRRARGRAWSQHRGPPRAGPASSPRRSLQARRAFRQRPTRRRRVHSSGPARWRRPAWSLPRAQARPVAPRRPVGPQRGSGRSRRLPSALQSGQ